VCVGRISGIGAGMPSIHEVDPRAIDGALAGLARARLPGFDAFDLLAAAAGGEIPASLRPGHCAGLRLR
jgi:hypothetical protein